MALQILSKLFGGPGIVKILRLFLFNPEEGFEPKDIAKRTNTDADIVRTELSMLASIGFLKRKTFYKELEQKTTRRTRGRSKKEKQEVKRKRVSGWTLNPEFIYLDELKALLIGGALVHSKDMSTRLRKAGNLKLLIVSGIFMHNPEARLDILLVGDNLKSQQLTRIMRDIETELGRELRYAAFTTQDFKYRFGMYDRLVRDVLDYPHQKIIDRIGVPEGTRVAEMRVIEE